MSNLNIYITTCQCRHTHYMMDDTLGAYVLRTDDALGAELLRTNNTLHQQKYLPSNGNKTQISTSM